MDDLAAGLSRRHKASGKKLISRILRKIVRLTGKQRFIDLQVSFQDLRICRDLFSGLQKDQVIDNQLLCRNFPFFSFTQNNRLGFCQDGQLINSLLSTDLLNDPDHGINKNDSYKHRVFVGTNQQYENQQHQVQKIEECQRILQNNLLICPGVGVFVIIYLTLRNSFLNFFVRKSCHASYLPVLSMAYGSVQLKLAHAPVMIVNKRDQYSSSVSSSPSWISDFGLERPSILM